MNAAMSDTDRAVLALWIACLVGMFIAGAITSVLDGRKARNGGDQ